MAEKTLTLVLIFLTIGLKISYMIKMKELYLNKTRALCFLKIYYILVEIFEEL